MGRTIIKCTKTDLKIFCSYQQLCVCHRVTEQVIHSLRSAFKNTDFEATLLIDSRNALNGHNRDLALRSFPSLCYSLYHSTINIFHGSSYLFIIKQTKLSQEGSTQGDSLAMAMFGIATVPSTKLPDDCCANQDWYADKGNA